ncbi:MAG: trypsin-like peptidase domain-containing protein [Oscillospiraceae bacterium]|nr:trypsin-like peptidase domain-containing protein [Oscillospiraceae bacterium]
MKKIANILLLAVCLGLILPTVAEATRLANFERTRELAAFSDVVEGRWYHSYIRSVHEFGVMGGRSDELFAPTERLTVAEAARISAVLHSTYHIGNADLGVGSPWYLPYIAYARRNGILPREFRDHNQPVSRADFAVMLARSLSAESITPKNNIADGAIPDVREGFGFGPYVYKLYRAGVMAGRDSDGTFYPARSITRAEAAAVIVRMVDADMRVRVDLLSPMSPAEIYRLAAPAVFYIEVFDRDRDLARTGSGFFISSCGMAVTNHHVMNGAIYAHVIIDGETFDVTGIYDYSWGKDLSIIHVDGGPFSYLEAGDSVNLLTGSPVYALGSPLGLQSTFTSGIISSVRRYIDGFEFIQTDAPISSGSSGGALLDAAARVIGITTAGMLSGQNLNFAVPIHLALNMNREEHVPLQSILRANTVHYMGFYPLPSFGAFAGVQAFFPGEIRGGIAYSYLRSDLPEDPAEFYALINAYRAFLGQEFFAFDGMTIRNGLPVMVYYNAKHDILVMFGTETFRGREVFTLWIS